MTDGVSDGAMTDGAGAPAPPHAGFDPELRIDWLGAEELADGRPGRLGLTFLPGKRGPSMRYPGHLYRRDAARDLAEMRERGVLRLILLVEDAELVSWGDPRIVEIGRRHGLEVRRFPVPDGSPPGSLAEMDAILDAVEDARAHGDAVLACLGGVGRTGLVAACALMRAGRTVAEAIRRVREVRHPTAVETPAQEAFAERYAAYLRAGRGASGARSGEG
ncbi:MAG TPA: protein-tyrosine-phosphatase [candidate division Zixibacteria bacterium]|nr:protein-tyrosine-phosphatase [candidate division Zixibacteria bacterium]